jgi:hypothetical protein
MKEKSRLFTFTVAFVRIAYGLLIFLSILLPVITLAAVVFPDFLRSAGTYGFEINALGMQIDLASGMDPAAWRSVFVASFAGGTVCAIAGLFVLYQLRRLLANVSAGHPFSDDSAVRIRRIGLLIIAAALVSAAVTYGIGCYFARHISIPGLPLSPSFSFPCETVLLGLIILVLSEVFRYGARLQEDHDLTV